MSRLPFEMDRPRPGCPEAQAFITAPVRFTPPVLVGDRILGVLRDELGVEYVVRYRFGRPS